jgi:hypothetical protein
MTFPLPETLESPNPVPDVVIGYLSIRPQSGKTLVDCEHRDLLDVEGFYGTDDDVRDAIRMAEGAGLRVVASSRLGLSVAGPAGALLEITGGEMVTRERLVRTRAGRIEYVTHLDIVGEGQPAQMGVARLASPAAPADALVLERPKAPLAVFPSPIPPAVDRYHLRVPDDVATMLGAAEAHRRGHVGEGVTVAMVDTGQFQHPFFAAHHYNVEPPISMVPGTNPAKDPYGHGTGESANIFAVAPGATLRPYRASNDDGSLVGSMAGFVRAKQESPDVLTNSWSSDYDYPPPRNSGPPVAERALVLEILDAIARNIVVIFAAGNGHFGVEAQVPGVIAAGGVFAGPGLTLQASTYCSGHSSDWFGGVTVPTVSGLVGMAPRAALLALPVSPGCILDRDCAGEAEGEPGDSTTPNDGWALFSGTSAAAPQVAGAAAVLRGFRPGASPAQVATALRESAVDVEAGRCSPRFDHRATRGDDLATGAGLINVSRALDRI